MFTFATTIKDQKIKANCQKVFKNAIGALFQILNKVSEKFDIFDENFALGFGFSYFFLERRGDYYQILSVDYQKNPFKQKTDDITMSLAIHNMQSEMIFTAKVKPVPTVFKNTMIVLRQAMKANDVYLTRTSPADKNDSGWYLGLTDDEHEDDHKADDFIKLPVCELLKIRPIGLRALSMPVGTLVTISGNSITAVVDENDEPIPFSSDEELKRREKEQNAKIAQQLEEAKKKADETKRKQEQQKPKLKLLTEEDGD